MEEKQCILDVVEIRGGGHLRVLMSIVALVLCFALSRGGPEWG